MKLKNQILFILLILISQTTFGKDGNLIATAWEYTMQFDFPIEHERKFILVLFSNNEYQQTIIITPFNEKNYTGVPYYELKGKWDIDDEFIYLWEEGKKNRISIDFMNKNFINLDNFVFEKR